MLVLRLLTSPCHRGGRQHSLSLFRPIPQSSEFLSWTDQGGGKRRVGIISLNKEASDVAPRGFRAGPTTLDLAPCHRGGRQHFFSVSRPKPQSSELSVLQQGGVLIHGRNQQLEILKKIALGTTGLCRLYREGDSSSRLLPSPRLEKHYSAANRTDRSAIRHP